MKNMIEMPLMNVRGMVFYPGMETSLFIGREFTIKAIQHALKHNGAKILVTTQKNSDKASPLLRSDMFSVGTVCRIEKSILTSDGAMMALLRAERRMKITKLSEKANVRHASGALLTEPAKKGKIETTDKRDLLELLVRWNPALALDDEDTRLRELKGTRALEAFLKLTLGIMCHHKPVAARNKKAMGLPTRKLPASELKLLNLSLKRRQAILEENNPKRQLQMIKSILREEMR
jgi:ATP-dependent Lon protease